MGEGINAFVGLDVHKDSTAIAVAEAGREAPRFVGTVGPILAQLRKALGRLGEPSEVRVVYEAGPGGYGLARQLQGRGYRVRGGGRRGRLRASPADRVKTDRRDALRWPAWRDLAIWWRCMVPDERDEAIRDLSRTREDAVRARLKARQQLKAMLLRHGRRIHRQEFLDGGARALSCHRCVLLIPPRTLPSLNIARR